MASASEAAETGFEWRS